MSERSFGITAGYIESFLYRNFPDPNSILEEVGRFGQENNVPIVGPLVGRFLHLLVRTLKPSLVLEIGTAIGYSTIWLASALTSPSTLITIEIDDEALEIAKKNIEKAELSTRVRFLLGDAAKLIPPMKERYDFIFLDTDKSLYPKLLPDLNRMLKVGGLLVADNTLWGGRVATNNRSRDTLAIKEFDKKIIDNKELFTVIIPVRDGVSLSLKLRE